MRVLVALLLSAGALTAGSPAVASDHQCTAPMDTNCTDYRTNPPTPCRFYYERIAKACISGQLPDD